LLPTTQEMESWMDRHVGPPQRADGVIEPASDLDLLDRQADLVLDCIVEDIDEKVDLFRSLSGCRARGAIFTTSTSGLSITTIGRRSGCGPSLVGAHFWNPPHLMPLVEVIRGADTADWVVEEVCRIVESIDKTPVRVNRDVPGFVGNRLLHALWREAIDIVDKGIASPEDVDLVARLTFGLRMPAVGPLENMDLVGLDLIKTIHDYLLADLADNHRPAQGLADRVAQGRLGVKSGQGFYDWTARDARELIERRNRQIVHQLDYLRRIES
jgi:3-hydroxybutyryl-CoA dehydrogenase